MNRSVNANDVFVKHCYRLTAGDLPSVVLYRRETLLDMLSLLKDGGGSMWFVDRTFDINCQHLTMLSYQNLKLHAQSKDP